MYYSSQKLISALQREWTDIVSAHFPAFAERRELAPVIRFIDSGSILGQWSGYPLNTISLNTTLLKHPWYVLLDVFRHEVAHQLNDLLHPNSEEPPHGEGFRKICALFGADPSATTEKIPLDDRVFDNAEPQDSVTSRVRKLLNLANGSSDNEAEVALCKAHQLMARHGLSEEALHHTQFVTVSIGHPVKRISSELKMLSALIHKFWPVEIIWCPEPDPHSPDRHLFALAFCGTPENVRIAAYVHDFILNHIRQEFTMRFAARGLPKREQRSFSLGVLNGLFNALERQSGSSREYALVLQKDARLRRFFRARFSHVRHTSGSLSISSRDAYDAGLSFGSRLTIAPGIDPKPKKELTK